MKAAIDLDGVVCDTMALMINNIESKGFSVVFDRYNPYIEGVSDVSKFIIEVVTEIYPKQLQLIKPYDKVIEALFNIHKNLGSITFLTARKEKFNESTLEWLNTYCKIPFELVNKRSAEKCQFILDNIFDVFVEDRLRTANASAELGIKTYLINRNWNIGRFTHKNVIRVDSLMEFYLREREIKKVSFMDSLCNESFGIGYF